MTAVGRPGTSSTTAAHLRIWSAECVEVADNLPGLVAVRDSKERT